MSDFWSSRFEESTGELDLSGMSSEQLMASVLSQPSGPAGGEQYEPFRETFFEQPMANPGIQNAHVSVGLNMRVDEERWTKRGQHFPRAPRSHGDVFSASVRPVDAMYDVDVGIARASRESLRGIALQSRAPRFRQPRRDASTPGPGAYMRPASWAPKRVCGFVPQSAAFTSTTDRFARRTDPHLRKHRQRTYRDMLEVGRVGTTPGGAGVRPRPRPRPKPRPAGGLRTASPAVEQQRAVPAPSYSFARLPRAVAGSPVDGRGGWAAAAMRRPATETDLLRVGSWDDLPADTALAPVTRVGTTPKPHRERPPQPSRAASTPSQRRRRAEVSSY